MKVKLDCSALETREVPAAHSFFNPSNGALTVNIDNNVSTGQSAIFKVFQGFVIIDEGAGGKIKNVLAPNGSKVAAHAVRSITVNGSAFDNVIDLRNVSTASFKGLDNKIKLYGNAGNDTILGSQFGDIIFGGNGNDDLQGNGGNDTIYGEAGNDTLWGGVGINYLDGGAGNDVFKGTNYINSRNVYVGGGGFDTVFGFSKSRDKLGGGIEKINNWFS